MGRGSASLTLKRLLGLRGIFPSFQPSLPTVAAREDVADPTHLQGSGFSLGQFPERPGKNTKPSTSMRVCEDVQSSRI